MCIGVEDGRGIIVDKSCFGDATQLLQEIDWKMSIIESTLQQIPGYFVTEEVYEIHHMLLEVSQLLLTLQPDPKTKPLAKGLSLQLQSIQEEYNRLFCRGEVNLFSD